MMQQYAGSLGTNVLSVVISATALTSDSNFKTVLGARNDFFLLTILSCLVLISVIYVYFRYEKK